MGYDMRSLHGAPLQGLEASAPGTSMGSVEDTLHMIETRLSTLDHIINGPQPKEGSTNAPEAPRPEGLVNVLHAALSRLHASGLRIMATVDSIERGIGDAANL